jgi:group I intron endonuclease
MSQDFGKGKIYKITNDYNDEVYIGSTCDLLTKRFSNHKHSLNNTKKKNRPLYKLINEIGFERFRIELIEEYPCQDKYELRQREGHFIRELGTLNKMIAGRSEKQYQTENKETIQEYKKEYAKENEEQIQKYKKDHYEANKNKISNKSKDYYEDNKHKIHEKITCECGCSTSKCHLLRHKKSFKHQELMKISQTPIAD